MTNIIQSLYGFKDKDDLIDFMSKFYPDEAISTKQLTATTALLQCDDKVFAKVLFEKRAACNRIY